MRRTSAAVSLLTICMFVPSELVWAAASVDISVSESGETGVVVYSGEANVCDASGANCQVVSAGCGAASVGEEVDILDDAEKAEFLVENFPFALDQEPLEADFQVGTGSCPLASVPPNLLISPDAPGAISASPN